MTGERRGQARGASHLQASQVRASAVGAAARVTSGPIAARVTPGPVSARVTSGSIAARVTMGPVVVLAASVVLTAVLAALLPGCGDTSPNRPPVNGGCPDRRLVKLVERVAFDPDRWKYSLYQYDDGCRIVRDELHVVDHGVARNTIYETFAYQDSLLAHTDYYVHYGGAFMKFLVQDLEYDQERLLRRIRYRARSELDTTTWTEDFQIFQYNAGRQLVRTEYPGFSWDAFAYDDAGNVAEWTAELLVDQEDDTVRVTYRYDSQRNPLFRQDVRMAGASHLSPNNIVLWESYAPAFGAVISRGTTEYAYDVFGYPVSAVETVVTPILPGGEPPDTMVFLKEYYYSQ